MDKDDKFVGRRYLDTLNWRVTAYVFHSSSSFERHHHHHHRHPYRRSERRQFREYSNKFKPPTLDGETKKSKDAEAWLLGMKKFFKLQVYLENMKAKITTFSLVDGIGSINMSRGSPR